MREKGLRRDLAFLSLSRLRERVPHKAFEERPFFKRAMAAGEGEYPPSSLRAPIRRAAIQFIMDGRVKPGQDKKEVWIASLRSQ